MLDWSNFFVAQVSASAALAGLLFVGISINMAKIVSIPILPNRALQALVMLFGILLVSSLFLVPGETTSATGAEVLTVGGSIWAIITYLGAKAFSLEGPRYRSLHLQQLLLRESGVVLYVVSGSALLIGYADGTYGVALAILVSFLSAIIDAWVLLVEINR